MWKINGRDLFSVVIYFLGLFEENEKEEFPFFKARCERVVYEY